jgi:hypothetical protein
MTRSITAQSSPSTVASSLPLLLLLWFTLILCLVAKGIFAGAPGTPPLALLAAVSAPVVVFLSAYRFSLAFRHFVLGIDTRVLVAMQAWRFAGFGFLALYVHKILPAYFAWPAGLGDMAIGVTAIVVLARLLDDRHFTGSRAFLTWNLLGLVDFVIALGTGAGGVFFGAKPGMISTVPMAQLPLALIPLLFVPIFTMLHLSGLFQRQAMLGERRVE